MRSWPIRAAEDPHPITGELVVECVTDRASLPSLWRDWDELVEPRSLGAVFRCTAWLVPWWRVFGEALAPRVYVARTASRLVGVLPAYHAPTRLGGPRLRLWGDGIVGSDYLGVLARADDMDAACQAIARAIHEHEEDVAFDALLDTDPLTRALAVEAETHKARLTVEPHLPCPILDVAGRDFGTWWSELPQGMGSQIQRRRRWLEKRPGWSLEIVEGARVPEALESLWRLHHARWAEEGGSDAVDSDEVARFHRLASAELAARGWARVYLLSVEGEARAALYGFERGGRFYFYQSGNDPAWRQRSVGSVVLGAALQDAFARGVAEFDFLRGDESYKGLFATGKRDLVKLRVVQGVRARALDALDRGARAGRTWVRDHLPPDAVAWLRRQRRRLRGTPSGIALPSEAT